MPYTYLFRQMTSEGGIAVVWAAWETLDLCLGPELDDAWDVCAVAVDTDGWFPPPLSSEASSLIVCLTFFFAIMVFFLGPETSISLSWSSASCYLQWILAESQQNVGWWSSWEKIDRDWRCWKENADVWLKLFAGEEGEEKNARISCVL